MKSLQSFSSAGYHDLIDYNVVDQSGDSVGSLHSLWSDANTDQLEFLGIKTGWLFGSNHVAPATGAQIDETSRTIQLPYELSLIKEAPSINADAEITDEQEAEIYRYYGVGRGTTATTSTRTTAETSTRGATGAAAGLAAASTATSGRATTTGTDVTAGAARAGETIEVPLSEEQLKVGKRTVETGSVRLRKIVRTEVVNQPVELRREEVIVERVPASEVRAGTAEAFTDKDIVVPVSHEEAVVSKESVVTGAVRVRKTEDVEQKTVSDSVRKEDVVVDRSGVETTTRRTSTEDIDKKRA